MFIAEDLETKTEQLSTFFVQVGGCGLIWGIEMPDSMYYCSLIRLSYYFKIKNSQLIFFGNKMCSYTT